MFVEIIKMRRDIHIFVENINYDDMKLMKNSVRERL